MLKRILASCLFLAGGLATWGALTLLQGIGGSMAGMSDGGPLPGPAVAEKAFPLLLYGYFLISAVSAVVTNRRRQLRVLFGIAHFLMLMAVCAFGSGAFSGKSGDIIEKTLTLIVMVAAFMTPWLTIWAWLLIHGKPDNPSDTGLPPHSL